MAVTWWALGMRTALKIERIGGRADGHDVGTAESMSSRAAFTASIRFNGAADPQWLEVLQGRDPRQGVGTRRVGTPGWRISSPMLAALARART